MSAFVVSDNHINGLVNYGVNHKASYYFANTHTQFTDNPRAIAAKLLAENYRSVNYRYREQDPPHKIVFKRDVMSTLKAVEILKGIDCLDYQCCETDDWKDTEAFAILKGLQAVAIRSLPGYETAAWGLR